jgi:hypothetical protein
MYKVAEVCSFSEETLGRETNFRYCVDRIHIINNMRVNSNTQSHPSIGYAYLSEDENIYLCIHRLH